MVDLDRQEIVIESCKSGRLDGSCVAFKTDKKMHNRPTVLPLHVQDFGSFAKMSIQHIDLKTAFFEGESYAPDRDVVCQLSPEAGRPWHLAAGLKKPAYGTNDS